MAKLNAEQAKAVEQATEDFNQNKPASASSTDSAYAKKYYDTYYKLRTEHRLSHIIQKYGPLK
jgi:hypothetical protein